MIFRYKIQQKLKSLLKLIYKKSFMLVDHRHIPQISKINKRIALVSSNKPINVIVSTKFCFLNNTVQSVLKQYGYAFQIKKADDLKLMGYTLPIICFQDIILQKQSLVQFISQICLQDCELKQFVQRKQNIKKIYQSWHNLLIDQFEMQIELINPKDLQKQQHINRLFQQFINFNLQIMNRGYQSLFRTYQYNEFNIQSILMMDITCTIIQQLPKHHSDHILRGYFSKQIDYMKQYKIILQNRHKNYEITEKRIFIDGIAQPQTSYPKIKLNLKWFGGIFGLLSIIYLKWSK